MITLSRPKTMKIQNLSILSNNKFNNIEVETASDLYFEFDKKDIDNINKLHTKNYSFLFFK